ncbi:MAG: 4Fe-4S dicluster domain-containing protein [Deltaproteobacteria bacterium]|jgi:carbon-monoxide dehydrogenase iron sulfur subunit|nr:4Fe-4S dicluster domain-containing protein [Deltaproteobacteria bacterium]
MDTEQVYAMAADAGKCKGCRRCELACIAAHNNLTQKEAIKERKNFEPRVHVVKTDTLKVPVQCRQCENAPCVRVCPLEALRQMDNGEIVMRPEYCAGCGLCVMVCPYGAVSLSSVRMTEEEQASLGRTEPRRIAARCDLCREWRAKEGKEITACMEACPAGVFSFAPVEEYHKSLENNAAPPCPQPAAENPPAP